MTPNSPYKYKLFVRNGIYKYNITLHKKSCFRYWNLDGNLAESSSFSVVSVAETEVSAAAEEKERPRFSVVSSTKLDNSAMETALKLEDSANRN